MPAQSVTDNKSWKKLDEDIRMESNSNRNSYTTEGDVIDMLGRMTMGRVMLKETVEVVPLSMTRAECVRSWSESGHDCHHAQAKKKDGVIMTSCGCDGDVAGASGSTEIKEVAVKQRAS